MSRLVGQGTLKTALGEHFGVINAVNLQRAHAFIEQGTARGKSCSKASEASTGGTCQAHTIVTLPRSAGVTDFWPRT